MWGLIYPSWVNNPFGIFTDIASEEPLIIVLAMMASSREDSPRRPRIIIHDPEAERVEVEEEIDNSLPMKPNLRTL